MFLFLCGGHSPRSVFSHLQQHDVRFLSWYPNLKEAGAYGAGGAIVGPINEKMLADAVTENSITGIIDGMGESFWKDSLLVMSYCKKEKIPYIKCLPIPYNKNIGDFQICCSYHALAEEINRTLGNVLLYMKPKNVKAFAKHLPDVSALYVPILRGAGFDVETALLYGIPLRNVLELDRVEDAEAVKAAIQKVDAQMVVCDGSCPVENLADGCVQLGVPLRLTHAFGIEFLRTAVTAEELLAFIKQTEEKKEGEINENFSDSH